MKQQETQPELYTHKSPILPAIALALSRVTKPAVLITFPPRRSVGIVFRNGFEKVVVAVTGVYFLLSVPLHVQTWYTQNTNYILIFPTWYSLVFLAYSSLLMFIWWRLKVIGN